ncbi:MAG: site-specific integrase, partial [Bacteroidales bacterium]
MFYLKRQKENANGEVPIYMRVTVNGIRAEVAIQRMIRPKLNLITDYTFKVDRLQQVADGSWQVSKKRKKTKRQLSIPLLKPAQSLVEKYQKHPCRKLNRIFPVLSNQKMNAYLKEVGDLCGITKEISSHLARHTFATTVALANNMPIEVLSHLLGHSTIPMTQLYARMNTSRLTAEMKKLDLVLDGSKEIDPEPMKALLNFNLN